MTRPASRTRVLGPAVVLLGIGAVLLSLVALDWYDRTTFADLRADADGANSWLVPAYFDWLVWVLLVALVALAAVGRRWSAPVGVVLAVVGAGLTYYTLQQRRSGHEAVPALVGAGAGVWFAFAGFALAAVGVGMCRRV